MYDIVVCDVTYFMLLAKPAYTTFHKAVSLLSYLNDQSALSTMYLVLYLG